MIVDQLLVMIALVFNPVTLAMAAERRPSFNSIGACA
jgi:hypothetical protein